MAFWLGCCTPAAGTRWGCGFICARGLQWDPLLRLLCRMPFPHDKFCRGCISPTLFCPLAIEAQEKEARMPYFHLKVPILINPLLKTNQGTTPRALGTVLVPGDALHPAAATQSRTGTLLLPFLQLEQVSVWKPPPGGKCHRGVCQAGATAAPS